MQSKIVADILLRPSILVVDDTTDNLTLISALLNDFYKIKVANSGEKALKYLEGDSNPDLILLDIMMPVLSGHDVIRRLKSNPKTRDIPVIFLTAMSEPEDEKKGLELGAVDYITKPISPPILLARIKSQLQVKAASDFLHDKNLYLETEIAKRTHEISAIQDVTILAMASLAETRDLETGNHIRRTQHYVKALAQKLKTNPNFGYFLSDAMIETLYKSAPLHDIGKVGIPDRILLKPGKLTHDEFEIMKTHTTLGRDAIKHAESQLGIQVEFLRIAKEIAYYHQEKYDGSGYPTGASGNDIPISARLMSLADVYDALISRRVYKEPMSHADAVKIILEGRGKHFDPEVVDAFLTLQKEFQSIAACFMDNESDIREKTEHLDVFYKTNDEENNDV
ncbi:MAG: two-component system response regulator [Sulfuricurvum sp.]|nr:two-component system response regulator [Sulfuricurvum sp.]